MKVFLADDIAPSAYARVAARCEIVTNFDRPEELDGMLIRQTIVPADVIERATKLRGIAMHGTGLDGIDMEAASARGIPVMNAPGINAQSVAELAVALLMSLARNIHASYFGQAEGRYKNFGPWELRGHELAGRTVGLVGVGNIAKRVARIMKSAFDCKIIGYSPRFTDARAAELGMERCSSLEEIFSRSDYVNISVPLTPETANLIDYGLLSKSKPGLILINTARGGIVNEDDLYRALTEGKIAGAGIDVMMNEPIPKDSPFVKLENCIITPHLGGSTFESLERLSNATVDHLFQMLDAAETG